MLRRAENAAKPVELPSACPCHSRLDARWAAGGTACYPFDAGAMHGCQGRADADLEVMSIELACYRAIR